MSQENSSPTESCLYQGQVLHHRFLPHDHRFSYELTWLYLNLDEIDRTAKSTRLLSLSAYGPISFRPEDHTDDRKRSLQDSVRERLSSGGCDIEPGPICLLTQPRSFGFYFCPLSLYFCYDSLGEKLTAILAEVSNTPWGERHDYVLDCREQQEPKAFTFRHLKTHHVSPFLPMGLEYRWRIASPSDRLTVSLNCFLGDENQLTTALRLERKSLSSKSLAWNAMKKPIVSASLLGSIYYQALLLWYKKTPFFPHPGKP